MDVVTRYAPSPTGPLHIGGARTALYSWAFARHGGGRFVLRFEDTDRARSKPEYEDAVLEALDWLGLDHDPVPGPSPIPRQTERGARYSEALGRLLEGGHAYRCVCTPDEVEEMRSRARAEERRPAYDGRCRDRNLEPDPGKPFCLRMRVPESGLTRWNDLIAGPSGEDTSQIEDFVIARTDGSAIYHLAVVVDDHEMGITHVIRGREHMLSTPRQLLLYQGLGWEPPSFAHVPLLVEAGGKKLSKRSAAVSTQNYRDRGFLPQAVLNFIARLGWSHGDLEIFSRDELARLFTLEGVGQSPAQVQEEKLHWLSQHYIKGAPGPALRSQLQPFLDRAAEQPVEIDAGLERLIDLLRERSTTLVEMAELARFYLLDEVEFEEKAARKHLRSESLGPLRTLLEALGKVRGWDEESLQPPFEATCEAHGLKLGQLAQSVRVAITGRAASPGIFETLEALGRERGLARIRRAIDRISSEARS
ncbi:MAG: glutamate--tRNA ligase [Myxococcota bacterium]